MALTRARRWDEATRRRVVLGLLATAWIAGLADQVLMLLNHATWSAPTEAVDSGLVLGGAYATAGALILLKNPGHAVGRTALYIGLVAALSDLVGDYAVYARLVLHAHLPLDVAAAWAGQWSFYIVFPGAIALLLLFFPDGFPPRRRWWLVVALTAASALLLAGGFMFQHGLLTPGSKHAGLNIGIDNPAGFLSVDDANSVESFGWLAGGIALVTSVVAVALRFRGARAERRQQLKWLAICVVPIAPAFAAHFIVLAFNVNMPDPTKQVYVVGIALGIPAAMAVALLKYRLYEIDVVISRALVYTALAALITGIYVAIVVGVGTLVGSGGKPNLLLSIVATGVVAVAFQPARERLQRVANRLVYGQRATPYEVLSEFSARVAESYAGEEVLPRMARVLADGTGAEQAHVWLRSGNGLLAAASWPADATPGAGALELTGQLLPRVPGADRAVPVRHQGELLGALSVKKRPGEALTPIEEKLLDDLAHQAGLVLKNVGLTADLQARLEELRASRQRLVKAQDDERRRLERNFHDGAQQHLVALKVKLGLVERLLVADPAKGRAALEELKGDADEALQTLRDLARGIYPPLLADQGLGSALRAHAAKVTVPVTVEAQAITRYSQEIEAAAYFCCLEALQNVQKYASASSAAVKLTAVDGHLRCEVTDDGAGFDPASTPQGSGLQNMADRLDALGGSFAVRSAPGRGTTVTAELPVHAVAVAATT